MIAYGGFGNGQWHGRKPLINPASCTAVAYVAVESLYISHFNSSKDIEHTQYARIGSIGILGKFGSQQSEVVVMQEKTLERKLVQAVKAMGGISPKFASPGFDGMPDRIVLLPNGIIAFVEVKQHGEKPRPIQEARHGLLRRLGFRVYVLDDAEQIGRILDEIQTGVPARR